VKSGPQKNYWDSWYVHIASVSMVAGQGCHMGTIQLSVSVVSMIWYNMHFLRISDYHWIAFMIMPKRGYMLVLDSADFDPDRYKEFVGILNMLAK
jgi:hypothetical protein